MLEYPSEMAKNKHDLVCPKMPNNNDSSTLQDAIGFANSGAIFQALQQQEIPKGGHLATLAHVYSYHDAPDPPLSRSLIVIGVADTALSVVRRLVMGHDDDENADDETTKPDCLCQCLVAVKRADGNHSKSLEKHHVANSQAFGKFMQRLRSEGLVAILALDKYQRFGILKPVPLAAAAAAAVGSSNGTVSSLLQVQDCFATIYVGNVNHVKSFLKGRSRPQTPPPVEKMDYNDGGGGDLWQPPRATADDSITGLWQPPGDNSSGGGDGDGDGGGDLWKPPGNASHDNLQQDPVGDYSTDNIWGTTSNTAASANVTMNENKKRPWLDDKEEQEEQSNNDGSGEKFHANAGAAAADKFYSGLKRTLDTRADSYLYHMRSFNGWVKATQIQELDPKARDAKGKPNNPNGPMRILDLACGKGGDLGKWVLHPRGLLNYVGSDVARGSLQDAAIRVRSMRQKLKQCTFTCADLGHDVPGRLRSAKHKQMQKLLTWSLQDEKPYSSGTPEFKMVRGGGIAPDEKFDVVSIQFAIHYMMQTRKRARRFFRTVSELLEVGGNLICTTMDARVVVGHLLNLGLNYHFDDDSWNSLKEVVIKVGGGACRISFEPKVVKKLFTATSDGSDLDENLFGLEYTFTLVEGSDHEAGVGDAVNLAEWLIPIPVLTALGKEAGLEIEYAKNFHEFYADRSDPSAFAGAHSSLYNMKVLNRHGSISKDEWEISRLYAAIKFRKVREPTGGDLEESDQEEEEEEEEEVELDPKVKEKLMPMAMMKAKKIAGADVWSALSSDEKKSLIEIEVVKLAKAG